MCLLLLGGCEPGGVGGGGGDGETDGVGEVVTRGAAAPAFAWPPPDAGGAGDLGGELAGAGGAAAGAQEDLPGRCDGTPAACCAGLPVHAVEAEVAWNAAPDRCLVLGPQVRVLLDAGHGTVVVAGDGDQVILAPHAWRVFGGGGDDRIHARGAAVVPGPGADVVHVGPGGRVLVFDRCEIEPGEVLLGGPGSRLSVPAPLDELEGDGLWAHGFAEIEEAWRPCRAQCRTDAVCFARAVGLVFDGEGTPTALTPRPLPVRPRPAPAPWTGPATVEPGLEELVADTDPATQIDGVVVFVANPAPVPVLPRFVASESRSAPVNLAVAQERHALLSAYRAAGLAALADVEAQIEAAGGVVEARAGVAGFLRARVPAGAVLPLAAAPRVVHVGRSMPVAAPSPPVPGTDSFAMVEARALTGADDLRASGADGAGYHVGLVENGVSDHPLLAGRVGLRRDCQQVQDGACVGEEPGDCFVVAEDQAGHGTSSAAILSGNDAFGDEDRGVTRATVDSWRVNKVVLEPGSPRCELASPESLDAGLTEAAAATDLVVGNVQVPPETYAGTATYQAALSLGDKLYAMGLPLVAAAGNKQPISENFSGSMAAPGRAQNTFAVGAVQPGLVLAGYSRLGPGEDGLVKPNTLGPTDLVTACAPPAPDCLGPDFGTVFGGTSAATPFVGGLATLLLHAYDLAGGGAEPPELLPGRLYATLTAFAEPLPGDDEPPDDAHGAGLVHVARTACSRWRWMTLDLPEDGGLVGGDLAMGVQGAEDVRVGAWWSNVEDGVTNLGPWDVAVRLVRGGQVHEAAMLGTNFQRLRVPALPGGTWRIEVEGGGPNPFVGRRVHVFVYWKLPPNACTVVQPPEGQP